MKNSHQCRKYKHLGIDHYKLVHHPPKYPEAEAGVCGRYGCDCDSFECGVNEDVLRSDIVKFTGMTKKHLKDSIYRETVPLAQSAARKLLREQVINIISDLTPREQKILRMRFGLDDGITHTLEEVGREFGVTRERIRQIQVKALKRMRDHGLARELVDKIHDNFLV